MFFAISYVSYCLSLFRFSVSTQRSLFFLIHIISYHIIISYQTLFQYHTTKQTGIKNTTWYWGHDQKAIKAWEKSCPQQRFQQTCKIIHFTNRQNTQKHTRHAPKWSQLYSDSKIDFSWFLKCLVVLQSFKVLSKEFQKVGPQFLIAQSENIFFVLLIL